MTRSKILLTAALLTTLALPQFTRAAPDAPAQATTQSAEPLTVAILDFDSGTAAPELGKQIPDALTAMLSDTKGIKLVDRTSIAKVLEEHALNATGLVDSDKAVTVGKLVGAKILVTGKVFMLGKSTCVTAKIIGTETSLVEGLLVKGKENDDASSLLSALSDKLAKQLVESGPRLIAPPDSPDTRLAAAKAALASLKKPVVVVSVTEQHHGQIQHPIDPAAETEIRSLLQSCGFTVVDEDNAKGAGAQYDITGEAFSEYAARAGNLVSCAARAEITIKSRADGKILLSSKSTTRATDLAENIAAKTALQKAGHNLAIETLEYFAKNLPAEKAK